MTFPEDIVNRSLDALGVEAIGDFNEGTTAAKSASRQYGPVLRQLLRAAHWGFARKEVAMQLVASAIATPPQPVPGPFLFEYLMPSDCLMVRYVPNLPTPFVTFSTYSETVVSAGAATVTPMAMSGVLSDANWSIQVGTMLTILDGENTENVIVTAITSTTFTATFLYAHPNPFTINGTVPNSNIIGGGNPTPLMTNMQGFPSSCGYVPMPYQVQQDTVASYWNFANFDAGNFGVGTPVTVILCNVDAAQLVYTALVLSPDEWDVLFSEALVATLAAKMAVQVVEDKKLAVALRQEQIAIAKMALAEARAANGNETFTTISREASWMRARNVWGSGFAPDAWGSQWYANWAPMSFGDGTVF